MCLILIDNVNCAKMNLITIESNKNHVNTFVLNLYTPEFDDNKCHFSIF